MGIHQVPYEDRQVWAAAKDVPVATCMRCPFFKAVDGGDINIYGQPGTCCYCREEEREYGMRGTAACVE